MGWIQRQVLLPEITKCPKYHSTSDVPERANEAPAHNIFQSETTAKGNVDRDGEKPTPAHPSMPLDK